MLKLQVELNKGNNILKISIFEQKMETIFRIIKNI